MTYYLLLSEDTEKDVYFDSNVLGEESFGTFYTGQGMVALNNIVNQKPELLETIKILDDTKKSYTLTEFMDIISKFSIKSPWLLCAYFVRSTSWRITMTDWKQYEILEEEFYKETPPKFKQPKKKKTWEQLQKDKERQLNKKKWQKKRRKSKNESNNK